MSRLNISLLGTFHLTLVQQPVTHFRSANNQGLLVYLVLHNNRPVAREVLSTLFWPEESDANARNNLRQSLYQLRKLLGDLDEPVQPALLVTRQAVQFNPECDCSVDVANFLQAVDKGDLAAAVSLYPGDLLPGFTCDSLEFEAWLRQERETLHNLALETMLEVTRDYLRHGRYAQAQTVARQQLSLEPWHEQAHRQLMQAYALAGDRSRALAQYDLCREVLAEELGIEPAVETTSLYDDIKAGRLGAAAAAEMPPPLKTRHNLPAATTPLIGRELECAQVSQQFTEAKQRLVTIVGPGGMGKTRLATAVGAQLLDQFRDGVYFIDLAPLAHPEEIGQAVAAALDFQVPDKNQPLFPQLLEALGRQNVLLILDNFEHLLDGVGRVNELLQAGPEVAVLATSRQRLNLASESRYELGGLDFPDWLTLEDALHYTAVQLFVENGRRVQPQFALNQSNVTDVVRLCQLVQGMPLGLVLAASWLELLTPAEIAAEIENSLDFLAAELADLPSRQRSMRAVFDYSWQMLAPAEQSVLARLSVFRGGFTREAAEQVAGANLRVLLALVNKSLLQRGAGNGRFTMHELLRQFAAAQRPQAEADKDALAHCHYFARLSWAHWWPINLLREMAIQHAPDKDNVYRAWEYALNCGLATELVDLAPGLMAFHTRQGLPSSHLALQAVQTLRQRGYAEADSEILWLKLIAQEMREGLDDVAQIREQTERLIPLIEKGSSPQLRFQLCMSMSGILEFREDKESLDWLTKAHSLALEMGDEILIRRADAFRLFTRIDRGLQDETTVGHLRELLSFFESHYFRSNIYYIILYYLQRISRDEAAYEQAIYYGKQSLNIARHWQDLWSISSSLYGLAETYQMMGLADEAKAQYLDALEWHLAIGRNWQTLGLLFTEVLIATEFIGGKATAVSILSMIYHHNEVAIFHKQAIDETVPRFKAEIEAKAFAAAWEKGKTLDLAAAVSQVRSALTTGG
ncbi:MAG: AAA family ATPase [Anaerolineaceae bacterium]|nr:AAA family ATPase [Anaerolineaceae bacterium]